jgi:D-serine deaminase-like pyridoxal phosphate-dependent protein
MNVIWNPIDGIDSILSPGLLIDADRVANNIQSMIRLVDGDASRLRPHVKTHKMPDVIRMQLDAGISKFKAATLAEASMVAEAGGRDVLLAYPMVGSNIARLKAIRQEHPETTFAVLVDHPASASALADAFHGHSSPQRVFIDVDCGMHRTGIAWGDGLHQLREAIEQRDELAFVGLHVYDGHLHQSALEERRQSVEQIKRQIDAYVERNGVPEIVAGGSPTFGIWAQHAGIHCSPGTTVFWDIGYSENFPDLPFDIAAALLTRIISKPGDRRVCVDLGYKAIASEMPLDRRLVIPTIVDARLIGQSEEHLVVETEQADSLAIGQPLLAFPRHICPTVALHDWANVVRDSAFTGERWPVTARRR